MTRTLTRIQPLCRAKLVSCWDETTDCVPHRSHFGGFAAPSGFVTQRGRLANVLTMTAEEFDEAVGDALDQVPAELLALMDNVVFLVEDEPPSDDPELLGVYDGTPLTERDGGWAAGALPDRITIFRGPTLRMCQTREEILEEVAVTVVHEIAHHFGIDDERLHELGWD